MITRGVNNSSGRQRCFKILALSLSCSITFIIIPQNQYERVTRDNDILNQRLTKAQQDYENQLMNSDQLAGENSQKNAELKVSQ